MLSAECGVLSGTAHTLLQVQVCSKEPHHVGTTPDAGRKQETAHGEKPVYSMFMKTHSQAPPQKILIQSMGWGEDPERTQKESPLAAR